jgi:cytochrome P450
MLTFNIHLPRDTRFDAQRTKNSFTTALRAQIRWLSFGNEANLFERWHPLRSLMRRWNARQMVQYVSRELDNRFVHNRRNNDLMNNARSKTIIDLALENHLADQARNRGEGEGMDATFKNAAICQIRTFLFAGHDTSSSTLCYCYHLLSLHPHARRSMVDKLGKILGKDVGQAALRIAGNPHLLKSLSSLLQSSKKLCGCTRPHRVRVVANRDSR